MTGTPTAGTYDITFSKLGYLPTTIFGVALSNGVSTTVNAELEALPTYEVSGMVTDLATGSGVPNANVLLANDIYSFEGITDAEGNFTLIGVLEDSYTLYAGKWGYVTNDADFDVTAGDDLSLEIWKGYYDDFIFDQGWTTTTTTDVGLWEKAEPNGTSAGRTTLTLN
jgi:hypothetical protein